MAPRTRLQVPQYTLTGDYLPLPAGFLFSPRVAPVVFGLGLLEAVPEEEIREGSTSETGTMASRAGQLRVG